MYITCVHNFVIEWIAYEELLVGEYHILKRMDGATEDIDDDDERPINPPN